MGEGIEETLAGASVEGFSCLDRDDDELLAEFVPVDDRARIVDDRFEAGTDFACLF